MDYPTAHTHPNPTQSRLMRWAKGLFWGWNIIFLAFMILGFAPRLIPDLISAIRTNSITPLFLFYAVFLSLVPPLTMAFAYLVLRQDAYRLFALGYVIEGPLMLILAVRFFAIRQGSTGLMFLMYYVFLAMSAFLWDLIDRDSEERSRLVVWLKLSGLTMMLLVAIYASVWIAFYALPGISIVITVVRDTLGGLEQGLRNPVWLPFSLLGMVLFLLTSSLFILAPVAVPTLVLRSWMRTVRLAISRLTIVPTSATVGLVMIVSIAGFLIANRQPQRDAFDRLAEPPRSPESARQLMKMEKQIRKGLLNAYLAPFRYISSLGEVGHIRDLYSGIVGVPVGVSLNIEKAYELVARPLLYDPVTRSASQSPGANRTFAMQREPELAAQLYQRLFDETIVKAESDQIRRAVRSTWDSRRAEDALQILEEHKVYLEAQELSVVEHGDWAEFELHEVYRNVTSLRQEVIYYFNLPETAVVTGIWLGNSADRSKRFQHTVAPRGAAQAVYREQVRRQIDPALIEQIGPRQYKLRVYPIEPIVMTFDSENDRWTDSEAPPLHLWLSWTVLADRGAWPMPALAYKRNVFWNEATQRMYAAYALPDSFDPLADTAWLPANLPAKTDASPRSHHFNLPGGISVAVVPLGPDDAPPVPEAAKLAVVIDRSRSMHSHAPEVAAAIAELRGTTALQIDVYLTASNYRGEPPSRKLFENLNDEDLVYFGGQNPAELLAQFEQLRSGDEYDSVLVISDATGYELGAGSYSISPPVFPIWFVHVQDQIPLGYDDVTLAAIQGSRGGVTGSVKDALQRIAVGLGGAPDEERSEEIFDIIDGYRWSTRRVAPGADLGSGDADPGFAPFAARRAILAEMQHAAAQLDDPTVLDRLHAWAQEYDIVTPYSSMIVLVNDDQRRLLEQLSQLDDRYQREVESLGDTTTATQTPIVGVPEPEEWLLIGIALALIVYLGYSRGFFLKKNALNP